VTADMCWATLPLAAAKELLAFDTEVAGPFADGQLCLICQYDLGCPRCVRPWPPTPAAGTFLPGYGGTLSHDAGLVVSARWP
jgi:hypothetical protein